jgi:hypothetical protein
MMKGERTGIVTVGVDSDFGPMETKTMKVLPIAL